MMKGNCCLRSVQKLTLLGVLDFWSSTGFVGSSTNPLWEIPLRVEYNQEIDTKLNTL